MAWYPRASIATAGTGADPAEIIVNSFGVLATAFTNYLVFAGSLAEQLDAWLVGVVARGSPWAAIISLLVGLATPRTGALEDT